MKYKQQSLVTCLPVSIATGLLLIGGAATAQEFSYNGDTGPAHWTELNGEWSACNANTRDGEQSPINVKGVVRDAGLASLDLETYATTIDVFNNGHTIEQRYEDTGTRIYFKGVEYELSQFHFHTLSEHVINNQHASMEMHLVFSEPGGTNLVIGQLFYKGGHSAFLQKLIDAGLPQKEGDETTAEDLIDVAEGLASTDQYYTYSGSLTTPPCSEVVTWVILQKPSRMSHAQFKEFRDILGNNFRPIQPSNGRTINGT